MAITNYTDFQTEVANYLARSDLTNQIPTFTRFAEDRLSRELRVNDMLKVVTTTLTSTDGTASLPNDFLEVREIHFNSNPVGDVIFQSPDLFFRNQVTTTSGFPVYFTILDNQFQFAPVPNGSSEIQMLYYARPPYLSSTQTSNIYIANYPDALLYATLAEASAYLMDDVSLQRWATMYDRSINNIKQNDLSKKNAYTTISVVPR